MTPPCADILVRNLIMVFHPKSHKPEFVVRISRTVGVVDADVSTSTELSGLLRRAGGDERHALGFAGDPGVARAEDGDAEALGFRNTTQRQDDLAAFEDLQIAGAEKVRM